MNKQKLQQLLNQRKAALAAADALNSTAETAKRDLTADETKQYDAHLAEVERLDGDIARAQKHIEAQAKQKALEGESHDPRYVPHVHTGDGVQDVSAPDQQTLDRYSFLKAVRQSLPHAKLDGVELEMHQEAIKEARANNAEINGLGIPQIVLTRSGRSASGGARRFRNDLTATGGSGGDQGGALVDTTLRPVIDILRESLAIEQMGATMLGGLIGNVTFPTAISGSDPTEKSENATADEDTVTFGQIAMSPKRLPVVLEVSKQLLVQSSTDIEGWLRNYLAFRMASRMDKMALYGSGSSSQPTGILNTSNVGLASLGTDGAAPTRAMVLELEGDVEDANAAFGTLGYLTNPKVRRKLKQVLKDAANTNSGYIWGEDNGSLNGYRAGISTNVPSNLTKGSGSNLSAMFYGNWAALMVAQWGGMDLLVNPYSKDSTGLVRINLATFYDVALTHPECFSVCKDIVTT